ncbi:AAA family ATPase [Providencia vermicola]|uniref:ATP-dependent nuclease n=1 Tax=Providencia vermicola TaxID=333965 RepID=UPI0032DAF0C9
MSVFIESIIINNFLSCKKTEVLLSPFTPLVGYNNAGKSNILNAIKWLLEKRVINIDETFLKNESEIYVSAEISGIDENTLSLLTDVNIKKIKPYIKNGKIKIRRYQGKVNGAKAADVKFEVCDDNGDWKSNPGGIEESIKNIFPEIIHIKAMSDSVEDSTKYKTNTTIGKLLLQIVSEINEEHTQKFNEAIGIISDQLSFDGGARFKRLDDTDTGINEIITNYFPDIKVKLHFETPSLEDIFKSGTLKIFEYDNDMRDMSMFGHGTQRTIQMALIQYLAKLKSNIGNKKKPNILLLIDEPELYLHPTAIELLREALILLSENNYQVIITTHSGMMITSEIAKDSVLVRKGADYSTYVRKTIKEAMNEKSNDPDQKHHMETLFTLTNASKILFSECVILVEGKTEMRVLEPLFKKVKGYTLASKKICLLSIEGKTAIAKVKSILKALDIPNKTITDLDYITLAMKQGFIEDNDDDIDEVKKSFKILESENSDIKLDDAGFPKKNKAKGISASSVYSLLGNDERFEPIINRIKVKLKNSDIYIWSCGDIESAFGFDDKDESQWMEFKKDLISKDSDNWKTIVAKPMIIEELVNWMELIEHH